MQKNLITVITATLVLTACNNGGVKETNSAENEGKDTVAGNAVMIPVDSTVSGCYTQISKRDTANLQMVVNGTNVTGPLSYNFFEKDRNGGTFQGSVSGNIISGWYLFKSEGVMSVRQAGWKVSNGQLWPANGEVMMRNDTAVFAKPDQLSYDSTQAFIKIQCVI